MSIISDKDYSYTLHEAQKYYKLERNEFHHRFMNSKLRLQCLDEHEDRCDGDCE